MILILVFLIGISILAGEHPKISKHNDGLHSSPIIHNKSVAQIQCMENAAYERNGALANLQERTVSQSVQVQMKDTKQSLGARTLLPTPVWIIGTYDKEGKSNMMTAAWVGICCSQPPCVTISLREATYTYSNIMERKAFTVNIPSEGFAKEASYFGSVSGRDVDKLAITGLTPVRSELVDAPYLKEFPLIVECEVIYTYKVGLHTMFIGEIKDVKADASILGENGYPDAKKLHSIIFSPGSAEFYKTGEFLGKLSELRKKIQE